LIYLFIKKEKKEKKNHWQVLATIGRKKDQLPPSPANPNPKNLYNVNMIQ
jgi:hypothetical protein